MDINKMISLINDVKPYDKGTAIMWTDEYIAKQLLEVHINPDTNVASRKDDCIDKTLNWIVKEFNKNSGDILDLGCGPGLYTVKLAKKGYKVTGVDFSENSIEYAMNRAKENNLDIHYICKNYLELDFEEKFDLIIMIYCDFGVLSMEDRQVLLNNIYNALKPGGIFIFDALNEYALQNLKFERNWEFVESGFWQDKPYLCLAQESHFPENKAILSQHIIIDGENNYKIYRFWNHYFDENDVKSIFDKIGFQKVKSCQNLLQSDGLYNDKGVTFYKVTK